MPVDRFTLDFGMTNAAFADGGDGRFEAARLLREVADRLDADDLIPMGADSRGGRIRDTNGNAVGCFEIKED